MPAKIISSGAGVERFSQYDQMSDDIGKMAREHAHSIFAETYSSQLQSTLADTEALGALLDETVLAAGDRNIPTDYLVRAWIEHSHNAHASRLETTFGTTVLYWHFHRLNFVIFISSFCFLLNLDVFIFMYPCIATAVISREGSLTK